MKMSQYQIKPFEYIYMFIMIIYAAHATPETRRMVQAISGNNIIPFLVPIMLTVILCVRHKVSFLNRNFGLILGIISIWSFIQIFRNNVYSTQELSYYFFLFYAVIIAYIHIIVYGKRLFILYEDILVVLSKISLFLWGIAVIMPNMMQNLFQNLPVSGYGHHLLYVFNLMSSNEQVALIIRNAGCSWEPGRFAVMLSFAICFNLLRNGICFKYNSNIFWLLGALISTQSTTGYFCAIVLFVYFLIKRFAMKYIVLSFLLIIPSIYLIMQLDFMGNKIRDRLQVEEYVESFERSWNYTDAKTDDAEMAYALDRFPSMYFEYINFLHDPIWGYGRNVYNSFFYKEYTRTIGMTGGLIQIFGMYGLVLGVMVYVVLFKSSKVVAGFYKSKKIYALFITFILSLISYPLFTYPVFTSFWLYGLFNMQVKKNKQMDSLLVYKIRK